MCEEDQKELHRMQRIEPMREGWIRFLVFIKDWPQQGEQQTMRLEDAKIATVEPPREGGWRWSRLGTWTTRVQAEETEAPSTRELKTALDGPGFITNKTTSLMHASPGPDIVRFNCRPSCVFNYKKTILVCDASNWNRTIILRMPNMFWSACPKNVTIPSGASVVWQAQHRILCCCIFTE